MKKVLSIHPDALYDAIYLEEILETDDFLPCILTYKGETERKNGMTVLTMTGHCLILESCFDNTIRFRITKPGSVVSPTTTERLGLINTDWDKTEYSYLYSDNKIVFSNKKLVFTFDFETGDY